MLNIVSKENFTEMNTLLISDENISKLCRICLNKDNLLIDIFTMSSKLEDTIMNAIISCAPVQITRNDGLPSSICKSCQKHLEVAHQFQTVALKSDKILQTYLKQKQHNQSDYSLTNSNSKYNEELFFNDFANNCPQINHSQPVVKVEVLSDFTTSISDETVTGNRNNKCDYETKYLCTVEENGAIKEENNAIKQENNVKLEIETSDSVDDDKTNDDSNKQTHTDYVSKECLQCEVCDKTFARQSTLRIHERIHSGEKPFKCSVCNKAFVSVSRLNYHKRRHDAKKLYKCDICDKAFNRSGDLWMHKRRHAGDKPHRCDVCNKSFLRPFELRAHIVKHTGEKKYQCDICDNFFTRKYTLNLHKKKHLGEKNHQCDMCDKRFVLPYELLAHKRKHTGEKVYQCEICGKGFVDFPTFSKHKQLHTGAKPFKCDICNRCFSRNGILKTHSRVHTGEKPYQCDDCGKSFTSFSSFRKHVRKHAEQS